MCSLNKPVFFSVSDIFCSVRYCRWEMAERCCIVCFLIRAAWFDVIFMSDNMLSLCVHLHWPKYYHSGHGRFVCLVDAPEGGVWWLSLISGWGACHSSRSHHVASAASSSAAAAAGFALQAREQRLRPAEETRGLPLLALLPQEGGAHGHQEVRALLQQQPTTDQLHFFHCDLISCEAVACTSQIWPERGLLSWLVFLTVICTLVAY